MTLEGSWTVHDILTTVVTVDILGSREEVKT